MAVRSSPSRCPICRAITCRAEVGLRPGRVCPTNVAARWRNITDGLVSSKGGFFCLDFRRAHRREPSRVTPTGCETTGSAVPAATPTRRPRLRTTGTAVVSLTMGAVGHADYSTGLPLPRPHVRGVDHRSPAPDGSRWMDSWKSATTGEPCRVGAEPGRNNQGSAQGSAHRHGAEP